MNEYVLKIWTREREGELEAPRFSNHELTLVQPREVRIEEIPVDVLLTAPALGFLTELRLTPNPPTDLVRTNLFRFASRIARELGGVVENCQPDLAAGEKKLTSFTDGFTYPPINEYTRMLRLNFWYPAGTGFDALAAPILDTMEKYLPYALPAQYGSTPEAEYDYEKEGGRAFFQDFLLREPAPVWCARAPVTHVYLADAARRPCGIAGFRASCLTVELPDKVYDIPEWSFALRRFFRELAAATDPFFAQIVRGEGGVLSWWWRGIPEELGCACVIGGSYYDLIPDCAAKGLLLHAADGGRLAYFEEPDGPFVATEFLSVRKKRLFAFRSRLPGPDDFTLAARLPVASGK